MLEEYSLLETLPVTPELMTKFKLMKGTKGVNHSLTHSLTYSLTYSLTHSLTH